MTQEERRAYSRAWNQAHREYRRDYQREWNKRNPGKAREYKLNYLRRKALREMMETQGEAVTQ